MSRQKGTLGVVLLLCGVVVALVAFCTANAVELATPYEETRFYKSTERSREDNFSLVAASLNDEVRKALELLTDTTLSGREYRTFFGTAQENIGVEQLRYYVRVGNYSDGRWPVFSLDESCEVQFHYDRISDSVLIYAQPRRQRDAQNDNYQSPPYLFVPTEEDFSAGEWYCANDSDYRIQIDRADRNTEEIYQKVRENWKSAIQ